MGNFAHLHVHTEYSLLDGSARINSVIDAAADKGFEEIAITDHGAMFGVIDFYKAAKDKGIKPILGCEVYVAPRTMYDRQPGKDQNQYHLVLLAENETGYSNLVYLVSMAYIDGFYYKPRVDHDMLRKHSEGLIALSACLGGEIPHHLMEGDYEKAKEICLVYNEIFGEGNFFLELQDHGIDEQGPVNEALIQLSRETGVPLVATNDVHYVERDDAPAHDVLLCIQTGKTLQDENRMRFPSDEFYLKTEEEMRRLFPLAEDSITNTREIAKRCNVEFEFGKLHLPEYQVPEGYTLDSYLQEQCEKRLAGRYPDPNDRVRERLMYELGIIQQTGFSGYFLIVADVIQFARDQGIPVGPGRGSAAGSLVAYVLGITDLDPLKYDLLFERFLNPERVNPPDIDSDFCFERRSEIIEYISEKYGHDHVCQIAAFGTMAAKAAIRDVGRVMGVPYPDVDKISKLVPAELGITLKRALEISPELQRMYKEEDTVKKIIDMAIAIEGLPRHISTHAAGLVISHEPLTTYVPLHKTSEGSISTQFPMRTVEELGLLKMDVLGLRTLTVIGDTLDRIKETTGAEIDLSHLPLDDIETYEMLSRGESIGVFQLESSGMRQILKNLRPERFEELIALVALYRPGPLGSGMVDDFIARKHGEKVEYPHPSLEDLLKDTYGVILYQEQVMRISSELAGFTLGQADLLRRAMGKKKPEIIAEQKKSFLEGAQKNNVDPEVAGTIFDLMAHFAGYGFNKSHSAAYAVIAYQTAWLKTKYPVEFMASLLSSIMDNPDKVPLYMEECKALGIKILPPDVNQSVVDFSVKDGQIRFGLAAVKNVGRNAIYAIIEAREAGEFRSIQDFCERVDLHLINKRMIESLIKCGAFDSMGLNRRQLMSVVERCMDAGHRLQADRDLGQVSLFDMVSEEFEPTITVEDMPEFPIGELLSMEREILGFYISGHPMEDYRSRIDKYISHHIVELEHLNDGESVVIAGIVAKVKTTVTKRKEMMATVTIEDTTGSAIVMVFPKIYPQVADLLENEKVLLVKATLRRQEDDLRLFCEAVQEVNESLLSRSEETYGGQLCLRLNGNETDDFDRLLLNIRSVFSSYPGGSPVYLDFGNGKVLRVDGKFWVKISQDLMTELGHLCGVHNVIVG